MPLELQVIRASEFVCLDPDEHLDFEASKRALQALAFACRKRGLDRAMLDLRSLPVPPKPLFTPSQLAALIATFHEAGFGGKQRLAVLYRSDPHGGARMFAFIGRIQGWHVQAFDGFEAALLWLSKDTESPIVSREDIAIPIVKREIEAKRPQLRIRTTSPGPTRRIRHKVT